MEEKGIKEILAERLMSFTIRLNKIRLELNEVENEIENDIFTQAGMWLDKTPQELENIKTSQSNSTKRKK